MSVKMKIVFENDNEPDLAKQSSESEDVEKKEHADNGEQAADAESAEAAGSPAYAEDTAPLSSMRDLAAVLLKVRDEMRRIRAEEHPEDFSESEQSDLPEDIETLSALDFYDDFEIVRVDRAFTMIECFDSVKVGRDYFMLDPNHVVTECPPKYERKYYGRRIVDLEKLPPSRAFGIIV